VADNKADGYRNKKTHYMTAIKTLATISMAAVALAFASPAQARGYHGGHGDGHFHGGGHWHGGDHWHGRGYYGGWYGGPIVNDDGPYAYPVYNEPVYGGYTYAFGGHGWRGHGHWGGHGGHYGHGGGHGRR
jgi:hypothetical protein